ncbi:MAG: hypothetical protein ACF8PN_01985 [Phycisphaerales bacterium]
MNPTSAVKYSVLAACATWLSHLALAAPEYQLIVLDFPGFGHDLNNAGELVGAKTASADAFIWTNGVVIIMDRVVGLPQRAYGVNSSGDIVGSSNGRPAVWRRRSARQWDGALLPVVSAFDSTGLGNAINDSGMIAGRSRSQGYPWPNRSVGWDEDTGFAVYPHRQSHHSSDATDINSSGVIVGWSDETKSGFLWDDGVLTSLPPLSTGSESRAFGLNDDGVAVGQSGFWDLIPVRWRNGAVESLMFEPWMENSVARDVNEHGEIVGHHYRIQKAIYWSGDAGSRLDHLVVEDYGWEIYSADAINDYGQIAATVENTTERRPALLSPVQMALSEPLPGRAGTVNSFTVWDATPGAPIYLCYSTSVGAQSFLHCEAPTLLLTTLRPWSHEPIRTISA